MSKTSWRTLDHAQICDRQRVGLTSTTTIRSPAMPVVCTGQEQCSADRQIWWCVTGEVVAESLPWVRPFLLWQHVRKATASHKLCRRSTTLHTRISTCMTLRCPWSAVDIVWLMWLTWVSRLKAATLVNKVRQALAQRLSVSPSPTCVHLPSRAQSVSSFLTRLELRMFEFWLLSSSWDLLKSTCLFSKEACCVRVDTRRRGLRSSELGNVSAFSSCPFTLSLFPVFLLFSQKVSGLPARPSERPLHRARTWQNAKRERLSRRLLQVSTCRRLG